MIRVTIEIVPHGDDDSDETKILAIIPIWNDLTNERHPEFGNYRAVLQNDSGKRVGDEIAVLSHKRELGFLPLVSDALDALNKWEGGQ